MKEKRTGKHCPECPEQCFCGSSQHLEDNHHGGRKHVPWLWLPNCRVDHTHFHVMCRRAGVDFEKQKNLIMGKMQALKAQVVGLWMVIESIEKEIQEREEKSDATT